MTVVFAHDTEVALTAAAALVNTAGADPGQDDTLTSVAQLDEFVRQWRWTGSLRRDRAELDAVRALRPHLARFWHENEQHAAELVNELLRAGNALPQLVRHEGWDYHIHATTGDAPLADRMAVEAAMAMADVIRMKELDRLRVCAADGCPAVLVDLTKNRSRRFCSARCSSRTNVAAFRARSQHRDGRRRSC